VIETYAGTLGPSVRAVEPILDGGRVVGLVAVGIRLTSVEQGVRRQVPVLLVAAAIALRVAGVGSGLISRWLRRQTHGLGSVQLRRMYEFYDAVLHAVREGPLLLADPRDLVTILGNLLDNAFDAVEAALQPRRVHVSASMVESSAGTIGPSPIFQVADSGAGLAPEQVEQAFHRGWSTKAAPAGGAGRGLGLALVSQAVHRYGGDIEVSSGPGAVFTVRLPVGPHGAAAGDGSGGVAVTGRAARGAKVPSWSAVRRHDQDPDRRGSTDRGRRHRAARRSGAGRVTWRWRGAPSRTASSTT
jgi:sensor histidine kinase regulating citrate/malate metabolism